MARNTKVGLDYFPMNVNFFEDDKIELIQAEFGSKGVLVALKLLCKIYKEGYYYKWGDDECLLFSKNAGAEIVPAFVNEVVNGLVRRRFFDKGCFDRFNILTSSGIQKRYFDATSRYKNVTLIQEYLLEKPPVRINVNINSINDDINHINANSYPHNDNEKEKEIESRLATVNADSNDDLCDRYPYRPNPQFANRAPNIPTLQEVQYFFKSAGGDQQEASRFYNHYSAIGWMKGLNPITNWRPIANTWIATGPLNQSSRQNSQPNGISDKYEWQRKLQANQEKYGK